jgi:hypothetical protein
LYLGFVTVGAIQVPICESRANIAIRLEDDATTDELPIDCWTTTMNESIERQIMFGHLDDRENGLNFRLCSLTNNSPISVLLLNNKKQ